MKPEQIIGIDIKIAQEILNSNGPVFSLLEKKILSEQGNYLLEVKTRYCRKCHKKTSHEWVRNRDFHYWRCSECLERHINKIGIFAPTNFCNKVSNNLVI